MVTVEERNALVEAAYRSYQEIRKDGIGLEALETWWRLYYLKLGHKALGRIVVGWPLEKLLRDTDER